MPLETKYVDREGIIETKWKYDTKPERGEEVPVEDMIDIQENYDYLGPPDFFVKDKKMGFQCVLQCLVCNRCELASVQSLESHVNGKAHIRKTAMDKRIRLGYKESVQEEELERQMRKNKADKELRERNRNKRRRVDPKDTLVQLMRETDFPCLGLEFVEEVINPNRPDDIRMYTCSLEGCKSAWGDAVSMNSHLGGGPKLKHNRNFLVHVAKMKQVVSLNKADLLAKCQEYALHNDLVERDYRKIKIVKNYQRYIELKTRTPDWSEDKANLKSTSANNEPIGVRQYKRQPSSSEASTSYSSTKGIGTNPKASADEVIVKLSNLHGRIMKNLLLIQSGDESVKEVTENAFKLFKLNLNLFQKSELAKLVERELKEVKEGGEELIKQFERVGFSAEEITFMRKLKSEVAEIQKKASDFVGSEVDQTYVDTKTQILSIYSKLKEFRPKNPEFLREKQNLTEKLNQSEDELFTRAKDLSAIIFTNLEQERSEALKKYEEELESFISSCLTPYFITGKLGMVKFASQEDFKKEVKHRTKTVLLADKNRHIQNKRKWSEFLLNDEKKENVKQYVQDVIKRKLPLL